jgi:hypothetical protein
MPLGLWRDGAVEGLARRRRGGKRGRNHGMEREENARKLAGIMAVAAILPGQVPCNANSRAKDIAKMWSSGGRE